MSLIHSIVLAIHVAAGGLAILLGAVALSVKKGGAIHRRSGIVFVCAMLVLGITAAMLGNVGGGIMTVYFVGTAFATVRPESPWTRRSNVAGLIVALSLALLDILGGVKAFNSPHGSLDGVPFAMLFFIATIMLLAAAGDARVIRSGMPSGRPRLARHLWRMCFALFIAAGSFFSIRARVARVLPAPFTTAPMRLLFYWLWRVRARRPLPVLVQNDPMPLATGPQ